MNSYIDPVPTSAQREPILPMMIDSILNNAEGLIGEIDRLRGRLEPVSRNTPMGPEISKKEGQVQSSIGIKLGGVDNKISLARSVIRSMTERLEV